MTFVSYAQNFEDVMLWRALRDVAEGFYIDAGAAHPDECSVTRAFYDRGWRGLNIEPSEHYFRRLLGARPRDTNLQVALGAISGETVLYEVPGTGLSTMDAAIAAEHRDAGWEVHERRVPMRRLADVCREHVQGDIHFLKVDVEGAERDVLAGADFERFRPWIVVVEATRPLSQEENHADWEQLVLGNGYRFVWFDGLNRFFVAEEKQETLARSFRTPPNTFDDFIRAADAEYTTRIIGAKDEALVAAGRAAAATERMLAAEQRAAAAEQRAAAAEQRAVAAEQRAATTEQRAIGAEQHTAAAEQRAATAEQCAAAAEQRAAAAADALDAVHASNSWRLTAPLRAVGRVVRRSLRNARFAG